MGVGAKVKIYQEGTGQLLGYREIYPSNGFSSSQPAIAHFGLGKESSVDLVVEMPFRGQTYKKNSMPANRLIVVPAESTGMSQSGLEATATTDTSPQFLMGPPGLPPHVVASTVPTVDFVPYPRPTYEGRPWSQWGAALFASNGKFYSAIRDHLGEDGNSYLYEYEPGAKKLRLVGNVDSAVNHVAGRWGHGKIHSQINEAGDDFIYMTSYWGTRRGLEFDEHYRGSAILRYPIEAVSDVAGGTALPPSTRQTGDVPTSKSSTPAATAVTSSPDGTLPAAVAVPSETVADPGLQQTVPPLSTPASGGGCSAPTGTARVVNTGLLLMAVSGLGLVIVKKRRPSGFA